MHILDTKKTFALDCERQSAILEKFPELLTQGAREGKRIVLPIQYRKATSLVFCGMGGSAIGADYTIALPKGYLKIPSCVVRGYELPGWINEQTLAVMISFSGNTEETLSCLREAAKKTKRIICLTHGGDMKRIADKKSYPCFSIPNTLIPRASLPFQVGMLISILNACGILSPEATDLAPTIKYLRVLTKKMHPQSPFQKNPAKKLASRLYRKFPLVIGSGITEPVARRFKDQINENAKQFSSFEFLPELNHNLTEGLAFPQNVIQHIIVTTIGNDYDHPQVKKRYRVLGELLQKKHLEHFIFPHSEKNIWLQKLAPTLLGDWTSYYLALLNRVDPTPVPLIEWAKRKL